MTYPSNQEYDVALSDPANSIQVKRIRNAVPLRHPTTKRFVACTGGYSRVYKMNLVRDNYALKCWTADVPDAGLHYSQIASYLVETKLPYFIEFGYEPEGILVGKSLYPTLWMKWASGRTLCPFIDKYIDQPDVLLATARAFRHMMAKLHANRIAHGDLQDGNIIAEVQGQWVDLTLIDYDSMAVPAIFGQPASIAGLPEYQSPYRDSLPELNERLDYFSELVIYLSLRAYAEKPTLWMDEQEKQLLFQKADFESPGQTAIWKKLDGMSPAVRYLADRLRTYSIISNLNALLPLEDVLTGYTPSSRPVPTTAVASASLGWDDFTNELLSSQTPDASATPASVITDESTLVETFEKLPEAALRQPTKQAVQMNQPTPAAVMQPTAQKSGDTLTKLMTLTGILTVISLVLLVFISDQMIFLITIGFGVVFVLLFVIAVLRAIGSAIRGSN